MNASREVRLDEIPVAGRGNIFQLSARSDVRDIKHKSINDVESHGGVPRYTWCVVACAKALPRAFQNLREATKYREKLSFAGTINHLEIRPG